MTGSVGVETFPVAGLSGMVTIRVEDTDRTPGERTLDSVSVDYLAAVASGGGSGGDPGDPGSGGDGLVTGESTAFGTVVGSYHGTHGKVDGLVEQLTEEAWAGGSRARLEHTWTVAVPSGGAAAFGLVAAMDGTERFVFECSIDGSTWIPVRTVSGAVDDTVTFPCSSASGSVLIRVLDADRGKGDSVLSSISVDWLHLSG